jgi:hypothetical protein
MLLAEFAETPLDLQHVRAFVFGEYYLIELHTGKKFDVRDLDTILSILHDEFDLRREQWLPEMQIKSKSKSRHTFNGQDRALEVIPALKGSFLPVPPVQRVVETVRRAVTMYNLTGSWDQFNKGNL